MNICSTTDKTGIGLFPVHANEHFWDHTCSVNKFHFIQSQISITFGGSSALLKMHFYLGWIEVMIPLESDTVFVFQIPNDIWKETSIIISILQMGKPREIN